MVEKEINLVTRIMGILGVIFTLIALLTPWASYSFTFGLFAPGISYPFYIDYFTSGDGNAIFFAIAMIIIFILTLVVLFMSISSVKNFEKTPINKFMTLGILLIVEIVLYVITVSIISRGATTFGAYDIGFVMAIIAAIMFFIVYGIKKMYMPTPAASSYQQQMYTQPQTYAPQQPPPPPPPQQPQPQQPAQTTEKKFCSNCGAKLGPNSKFCPNCGKQL